MMRASTFALVFAAFIASMAEAQACSCAFTSGSAAQRTEALIASSTTAFTGRVIAIRDAPPSEGIVVGGSDKVAEIAVMDVHKGRIGRTAFVVTDGGPIGASCTLLGPLMAGLSSGRPLTFTASAAIRIAGVRAHPVSICGSGPSLSRR